MVAGLPHEFEHHRGLAVDRIDAELIRALQLDGRASLTQIAEQLEVSRDAVSQRLRSLIESEGLRVVAALDPRYAGHPLQVNVKVEVIGKVTPVAHQIADSPNAVFVSVTSGQLPLVFESRHGSIEELHTMLDEVRSIPGVRRVHVSTYTEVLRGYFVAPERSDITLDELDFALIAILQQDGRASYRALADAVHLSQSSARARVRRLVAAGVIRIAAITVGGLARSRLALGVGISIGDRSDAVREYLSRSSDIGFAARSYGTFDYIATLHGTSPAQLFQRLEELRGLPGVNALDSWTHYDLIKEDYVRSLGRVFDAPED